MIRLTNLRIRRISTVDTGDNPHADIVLMKRKNKESAMSEKDTSLEAIEKQIEELTKQRDEAREAEKERDGLFAKLKALFGKDETSQVDTGNPELDAVVTDLRKERDEQRHALEKTQAELAKVRADQEREKMIKTAADLKHLGPADDVAERLVKIRTALGGDEFQKYLERERATAEKIRVGGLLQEFGTDTSDDVTTVSGVEARIEKGVQAIMAKSTDLTKEQAEARFYETPEGAQLLEQYQEAFERRQKEV